MKYIKFLPHIACLLSFAGAILEHYAFSGIAAILLVGYSGFNYFNKQ